ncbi:MAG: hypothetical protein U1E65_15290 [Myxococcota bacterium]
MSATSPHPDDVAREVLGQVRSFFVGLAKGLLLLITLSVAGIGGLFHLDSLMVGGLSAFGAAVVAFVIAGRARHHRLVRAAERRLVARAELEGVRLHRSAEAVLTAFDLSYERALDMLASGELKTVASDVRTDLDRVREHLFDVIRRESEAQVALRKLDRVRQVASVQEIVKDSRASADRLAEEANQITADTHRLVDRLSEVRRLSSGKESLDRVLEDLDRTARAYQEIEAKNTVN